MSAAKIALKLPPVAKLPKHIGIIMDGNGRWAVKNGMRREESFLPALKNTLNMILDDLAPCVNPNSEHGIKQLTLYAFSTENWRRPQNESDAIFYGLFNEIDNDELIENFNTKHIKFRHIGRKDRIPADSAKTIGKIIAATASNNGLQLVVALDYGGRDDIVRSVKKIVTRTGNVDGLSEELIAANLDTADLLPLDLIVRTGGHLRISNFLLWDSAYAEFYFTDTLWPEFGWPDLVRAFASYADRVRHYGAA